MQIIWKSFGLYKIKFLKWSRIIFTSLIFFDVSVYGAAGQILTDNFFQNPAELCLIKQAQLIGGNVFIVPVLEFTGTTALGSGSAKSKATDSLPYLLAAYRFTDKFVAGINITPSAYGHLNWRKNSIVTESSTVTRILYYRIGSQASYQFTDKLALGIGSNLEYNKLAELDFVVPNMGNQINKVKSINYSADIGLFYKLNPRNFLTFAVYTQVNTYGHGASTLSITTVSNFSLTVTEAPVAYLGFQHWLNDKWFLENKIYWSGWSLEKNVKLINTTTGSSTSPANWKDVWSFQIVTHYTATDKIAIIGAGTYETNPVPVSTNQIGYPLTGLLSFSAGVDLSFLKDLSAQLVYSYGIFTPKANINNSQNNGYISGNFQSAAIQLTYKI